jgi:anti-anti-sigma regulatory factor
VGVVQDTPGLEWDGHVLLLHRTEDERLTGLTAWVRRGLELDEKVVYTEVRLRREESLFAVLDARGVDAATAVRDGRLAVLPPEEFYPPDGQHVVVERALAEGFGSVRISAEVRAALSVLSPDAVRGVERQIDDLVRIRPVSALCQYARASTTGALLDDAVATHLFGVRESTFATAQDLDGLALRGRIYPTNTDVFTAVLAAASRNRSGVLWLDLADVAHVDAGSCWQLDDATRAFRAAGGHVLLVAPQAPVERTLWVLEVDDLPGMHLVTGER